MTEVSLLKVLNEEYGLSGKLTSLYGEYNNIYHLDAAQGVLKSLIVKVRTSETIDLDHLAMQVILSKSLNEQLVKYKVPKIIPTLNGQSICQTEENVITVEESMGGVLMAKANPILPTTRKSLGEFLGLFHSVLNGQRIKGDIYHSKWDNNQNEWIGENLGLFLLESPLLNKYYDQVISSKKDIDNLRKSICHNDANEYNVFLELDSVQQYIVKGFIDFGDAIYTQTINDVAIASAYAMMNLPDPLAAAGDILEGFNAIFPVLDEELEYLFLLIKTRLVISLVHSKINAKHRLENEYLQVHTNSAWKLLETLDDIHPRFANYYFRYRCGLEPFSRKQEFVNWIVNHRTNIFPLFGEKINLDNAKVLDLSVDSKFLGTLEAVSNTEAFTIEAFSYLKKINKKFGIGRYDEIRLLYDADTFLSEGNNGPVWRTLHIGLDVFAPAYTQIYLPLDGTVVVSAHNDLPKDYGNVIIIKHQISYGTFYTLYGHLSNESTQRIKPGDKLIKGQAFAKLGNYNENGDWVPHIHFQIILDDLDSSENYPGVANPEERHLWLSLCPDPNLLLGIKDLDQFSYRFRSPVELITQRSKILGPNLSIAYPDNPLHIVRGKGVYLIDYKAQSYLDMVNNVAHVGHENPVIVKAGQDQMAVLNTNTRYLHVSRLELAESLLKTLPENLEVVYFTNSGSEANELAIRMAKTHTGNKHMIVLKQGYHGNTQNCIDVSSYKFDNAGGSGKTDNVTILPTPDIYNGLYQGALAGEKYISHLDEIFIQINQSIAGFIGESILSCAGQIVPPKNYYKNLSDLVNEYGGIFIADEVQTGFGRVGSHFWAFEMHDIKPDIVTMGKPMGNGHPIGAVVTSRAVADSFNNGMEYFNTFGGNPVSCEIGLAVINYIKENDLQEQAKNIGYYILSQLILLKIKYSCIGDVRGSGLFLGIEFVDKDSGTVPHAKKAKYVVKRMRQKNILLSVDGPNDNVIKIKPPMLFDKIHASSFLTQFEKILNEDFMLS